MTDKSIFVDHRKPGLFILFFIVCNQSCTDWDLGRVRFIEIITVGATNTETNGALLLGDVENNRNDAKIEVGFVVAESSLDSTQLVLENAEVIIALPDIASEGNEAFVAKVSNLRSATKYQYRAFLELKEDDSVLYGEIKSFTTSGGRDLFLGNWIGNRNCGGSSFSLNSFEVLIEADIDEANSVVISYNEPTPPPLGSKASWTGLVMGDTLMINETTSNYCEPHLGDVTRFCGVLCGQERVTLSAEAVINENTLSFDQFNILVLDTESGVLSCDIECTLNLFKL